MIVLDAVGVGDLPDAEAFGTAGSNTLAHVADAVGGLDLPSLQQLGLGNVLPLAGCAPRPDAPSVWGRLAERSLGMDTTTGHWEMVGIVTERAFPTYPDGFPAELLDEFSRLTGRAVIGNVAASGTEIIQRLGEEHQRTGAWIVYTSADSVFQVAAHEQTVPVEELYAACRIARELLVGEHAVGRVIARPFEGPPGGYRRTAGRHDFSLLPPRPNHLQRLREAGVTVHGVGKISDIFAGQDIDTSTSTESNGQGVARTISRLRELPDRSLVFTNLVETDMVWGHRNDPQG
ncbi:MAG: phosphopentomutase, partial [Gaiellales bacterium]|nr:phosphopentomutase [Gaiellales bacterium]